MAKDKSTLTFYIKIDIFLFSLLDRNVYLKHLWCFTLIHLHLWVVIIFVLVVFI